MGAAELHDDGERTYEKGDGDVLQDLLAVGHHQDEERGDVEHQRQLQDDEGGHLAEHLRRGGAVCHLVGQRRGRQTYCSKAHCHRVGYKTDDGREHGLEPQTDKDGSRDGDGSAEACHAFEHTTEAPRQQQHQQTLVGRELYELGLDGLYLLRLTKDVVAEDGTDDDQYDGEACLEQSLDHRPPSDGIDAGFSVFLGYDAKGRRSEQR